MKNNLLGNNVKLFYDWNHTGSSRDTVEIQDETLRDGLQASYVRNPSTEQKLTLLKFMNELRIDSANIGFPGAGERHVNDVLELARFKKDNHLGIELACAARTSIDDISPIVDISQKVGIPIEVGVFLGSSEIRRLVEKWSLKEMGKMVKNSVAFAVENNLPVMFVTEDTTRAFPKTLIYLYRIAIENGATRVCVSDTVGYATPKCAEHIIEFFVNEVVKEKKIKIDWHGHRDRNLEIANCFSAIKAGASRVHGTALGVGERSGNVQIDLLLINLYMEGLIKKKNLLQLSEYVKYASIVLGFPIPVNYPVLGDEAYTTSSGIHAAAQLKAEVMKRDDLVARIYSGVDPRIVGRMPKVEVGPMSGKSNVVLKLRQMKIRANETLVNKILAIGKSSNNIISEEEIQAIVDHGEKD